MSLSLLIVCQASSQQAERWDKWQSPVFQTPSKTVHASGNVWKGCSHLGENQGASNLETTVQHLKERKKAKIYSKIKSTHNLIQWLWVDALSELCLSLYWNIIPCWMWFLCWKIGIIHTMWHSSFFITYTCWKIMCFFNARENLWPCWM